MKKKRVDAVELAKKKLSTLLTPVMYHPDGSLSGEESHFILDGCYIVSDSCEVLVVGTGYFDERLAKLFLDYLKKHPKPFVANADNTDKTILLSEMPTKMIDNTAFRIHGTGILGCTTLIENAPRRLLVLDEFCSE